jgi:hypothetical protein
MTNGHDDRRYAVGGKHALERCRVAIELGLHAGDLAPASCNELVPLPVRDERRFSGDHANVGMHGGKCSGISFDAARPAGTRGSECEDDGAECNRATADSKLHGTTSVLSVVGVERS